MGLAGDVEKDLAGVGMERCRGRDIGLAKRRRTCMLIVTDAFRANVVVNSPEISPDGK